MQLNKKQFYWINFVWFQILWLIAVFYTSEAILVMLSSLCAHFLLSPTRLKDLSSLLQITAIGSLGDYLLSYLSILNFTESGFIPLWLILLWTHFAVTLNHGMSWLTQLPGYARSLFGAVFGTLSYYAGAQMQAVALNENLLLSLLSLALIWAVLLPIYIIISDNINCFVIKSTLTKKR